MALIGVDPRPCGRGDSETGATGNAYQTIGELESVGYDVVIDRVGSAPIGECFVTNVRNPQVVTQQICGRRGVMIVRSSPSSEPVDQRIAELRRLIPPSGGRLRARIVGAGIRFAGSGFAVAGMRG